MSSAAVAFAVASVAAAEQKMESVDAAAAAAAAAAGQVVVVLQMAWESRACRVEGLAFVDVVVADDWRRHYSALAVVD